MRVVKLGGGVAVPYPEPGSEDATAIGIANRRTDTKAELHLRRQLHAAGLRFRKDYFVKLPGRGTHIDIAFTRIKLAVFVDGCFWHCCPEHFHMPKTNLSYWEPKLAANIARDRRVDAVLTNLGWKVHRVWEHEVFRGVAPTVIAAVDERRLMQSARGASAARR